MTGVLLAVPPADFVLHNSLFLVAHFHNVIIGGVVFGLFAGITYWFPKGLRLQAGARSGASAPSGSGPSASMSPSCRCTSWA
jgi:cytochrome o ubiquinol oxidase subunit 1